MTARRPLVFNPAANAGKGQIEQVQTGDVIAAGAVRSTDASNVLGTGSDGGITYTGQLPQAAINIGDTVPVPAGGNGAEYWSTAINEIVRWDGAHWGQIITSSGVNGGALPPYTAANNGQILEVVAGAPAWTNVNPFIGPIGGWPAIGGG
jgi:hypothetical protein